MRGRLGGVILLEIFLAQTTGSTAMRCMTCEEEAVVVDGTRREGVDERKGRASKWLSPSSCLIKVLIG